MLNVVYLMWKLKIHEHFDLNFDMSIVLPPIRCKIKPLKEKKKTKRTVMNERFQSIALPSKMHRYPVLFTLQNFVTTF